MSMTLGLLRNAPNVAGLEQGADYGKLLASLHRLATLVEREWEALPVEQREALKAFAYFAIEPPKDIKTRVSLAIGRVSMAFRMLRGNEEEIAQLVLATHRLVHAVLDAVERENAAYVSELSERLAQLDPSRLDQLPKLPESESERRAWLEKLLD